jgi:uncharacterized protein YcgI (DUF1989 family)
MLGMENVVAKHHVPAGTGKTITVEQGDLVRITDLEGQQPVDFWAFNVEDPKEFLSCEHTKVMIGRLSPVAGHAAYTNQRRPIVTVVEDNSPGEHDMECAACDILRYRLLGAEGYHANCQDNLHGELRALGLDFDFTPQPWNLFTNVVVHPDRTMTIEAPANKAGDNIVLRAEMDAYIVVSPCAQDIAPTCGGRPTDIQVEVGR